MDAVAAVARALAYSRPGSHLIAYQSLGLPAYVLRLEAVAQRRKPVPAIEEFVLASIDAGVDQPDDIAGYLGLDARLTERALVSQLGAGHVAYSLSPQGSRALALTPRGLTALRELVSVQPERTEISVVFDRLRWKVGGIPDRSLIPPRDFRWACARPQRTRLPTLDEIEIDDVATAVAIAFGRREARRDPESDMQLLSVSAIQHSASRYVLSAALVYQPIRSDECDLVVAVDGRPDMTYTESVIAGGGRAQVGVDSVLARRRQTLDAATKGIRKDLSGQLPSKKQLDATRSRLVELEQMLGARGSGDTDGANGLESSEDLRDEIARERRTLHEMPVRFVEPWEHVGLLNDALEFARTRCVIAADVIGSATINPSFLGLLERACRRGVSCVVVYREELDPGPGQSQASRELLSLAERLSGRLSVVRRDERLTGALIVDDEWVASQFPWLSFVDDMGLRVEVGLAVTLSADVEDAFVGLTSR